MEHCAVAGCQNKCALFPFPSDFVRRVVWKKILDINKTIPCNSYVCILHFEDKYIDQTGLLPKLKENAVPYLIKNMETNRMDTNKTDSMPGPSYVRVKVEQNVDEHDPPSDSDDSSYEFSGVRVNVENNAESDESGLRSSVICSRDNEETNASSSKTREPTRNETIKVPLERPQNSSNIREVSTNTMSAASKCDKGTNTSLCSLPEEQKSTEDQATRNSFKRILNTNSLKVKTVKKVKNAEKKIKMLKLQIKRKNEKIDSMKRIIQECFNMM
ncbi:uncharacterized protein LOC105202250 isoform X2 [Solenopsis invicta]|uniref:uncharacterized protein LOC105202250 isoform X2 n=1 Tax=Solenopsis invicta TaxID=13686 RepID=UPI000595CC01|nr:uncharacterized protein LOC105202250 isoform X2 [Solenopsis invicta]